MDVTGTTTIHSRLPHIHLQRRETLIKTPAVYTAWAKKLRISMPPTVIDKELPQLFKAERGASQGAVLSPTAWITFFDILLVALSSVKEENILLPGLPGNLFYTHDRVYVDEQITPSATLEALQKEADIISVFYIIFGVDIAMHKLMSYLANLSSANIPNIPTLQSNSNINETGCTCSDIPGESKTYLTTHQQFS